MKNNNILLILGLLVIFIGLVIGIFHIRSRESLLSTGSLFSKANDSTISTNPAISHGKININIASSEELSHLPGIGTTLALKIEQYRFKNGKFRTISDLMNVDGMNRYTYESVLQYITVD